MLNEQKLHTNEMKMLDKVRNKYVRRSFIMQEDDHPVKKALNVPIDVGGRGQHPTQECEPVWNRQARIELSVADVQ